MSEWFKKAFGEDYLALYAHRDMGEAERVVDLVLGHAKVPDGGLVLDVPCGAGRHLQAFQQRGYRALGFDLSRPLLIEALESGAVAPGTVARADLRAMPFKTEYADLAVNLFSSLGYFATDEQNLTVLDRLVKLVRRGGYVAIDFMNSAFLQENLKPETERKLDSGLEVKDRRWIGGDPVRVNKRTHLRYPDGREDVLEESVRLFSPADLRSALAASGVVVEAEFGGYSGEPFGAESPRVILIGRRQ